MAVLHSRSRALGAAPSVVPLLALIAVVFFAGSMAGFAITNLHGRVAAIWVGNAFVIAAALKSRRKVFPLILATAFLANIASDLTVGDTLLKALTLTLCNVVEIAVVVQGLHWLKAGRDFSKLKTLLAFYALALGPAPAISALLAGSYLHLTTATAFWHTVGDWYASDALDLVILVPPLVTVRLRDFITMFGRTERSGTLILLATLAAVIAANQLLPTYPVAFFFFPAVLMLTFMRGFAGGAVGLFAASAYFVPVTLLGPGVQGLQGHTLREQIMVVQIFVAALSFTVVLVGAALEERRRLELRMVYAMSEAEDARAAAVLARDEAQAANRTKSMFLANMSHELRTPLNAVIGFSELMENEIFGPLGDNRYRDYAKLVHGAGVHLLDLINDVLDMSKIEAGKLKVERASLDLCDVVEECLKLVSAHAVDAGVTLSSDLPKSLVVAADRRALKQILLNLLSNAVKFTPSGGEVRVSALLGADRFQLCVHDSGVGIAPQDLERLGRPFVQLRESADHTHKGTGLGLALVRSLAALHGGTMHIESRQGAGTAVTVEIPLAAGGETQSQDARAA